MTSNLSSNLSTITTLRETHTHTERERVTGSGGGQLREVWGSMQSGHNWGHGRPGTRKQMPVKRSTALAEECRDGLSEYHENMMGIQTVQLSVHGQVYMTPHKGTVLSPARRPDFVIKILFMQRGHDDFSHQKKKLLFSGKLLF